MGRKRQPVERVAVSAPVKTVEDKHKEAFEAALRFAKQVQTPIWVKCAIINFTSNVPAIAGCAIT